jgi:Domain of unknown function (DUF6265)
MRTILRGVTFGGSLLLLASVPASAQRSSAATGGSPAGWLAGCWALEGNGRIVEESWMPARGGVMLGMSRTTKGDRVTEHEFVLLRAVGSTLEYRVRTGDQPEVVFRAAAPSASEAVFENPAHDFPKRVGYRLVSADSLEAWIDGGAEGKGPKIGYGYHRVDCAKR